MLNLDEHRDSINHLCRSLEVKELEIFGSAIRDDFGPDSDIDVLISFTGTHHLFDRYFELKEGLEAILGRRVDVVMPQAIRNPIFQEQVDRERKRVFAA